MAKNFSGLRVLVVDDEPLIRWSVGETLSSRGCHVVEAADAGSARAAVTDAPIPFDVAVIDLRLPDSSDLTLLTQLRQLAPDMQIILMTAYGTNETFDGALDLGAFRVVHKPFEVEELASLVQEAHAARPG